MNRLHPLKQGSALISALFVMTLIAIAATAMSTRLQLDIYRTRLTLASGKSYLASQLVTFWAMSELSKKDWVFPEKNPELLPFPEHFSKLYPDMEIQGGLYDLQARFNLNNLSDKQYFPLFLKLLKKQFPESDDNLRDEIVLSLYSAINPYSKEKDKPMVTLHWLQDLSEFRLFPKVTAPLFLSLQNDLMVVPDVTPINLNTASPKLLRLLGKGLKESELKDLLSARTHPAGFPPKQLQPLLKKWNIPGTQVTLMSRYFLVAAKVTNKEMSVMYSVLLKRETAKKGEVIVSILREVMITPEDYPLRRVPYH